MNSFTFREKTEEKILHSNHLDEDFYRERGSSF